MPQAQKHPTSSGKNSIPAALVSVEPDNADDAHLLARSDEIFRSGEFLSIEESENFLNSILNAKS